MKLVVLLLAVGLVAAAPVDQDITSTTPLPENKTPGLQSQLGQIGQGHNLNPSYVYPGMQNPALMQQGLPQQGLQGQGLLNQGLPQQGQFIGQKLPSNMPLGQQFIQQPFLGQQPFFGQQQPFMGQQPFVGQQGQLIGQVPYLGQQGFAQNLPIANQGLVGHAAPITRTPGLATQSTSNLPLTSEGSGNAASTLPSSITQTGALPVNTGLNTNLPLSTGAHSTLPLTSHQTIGSHLPLTGSQYPITGVHGIPIGSTLQPGNLPFSSQNPYMFGTNVGMGTVSIPPWHPMHAHPTSQVLGWTAPLSTAAAMQSANCPIPPNLPMSDLAGRSSPVLSYSNQYPILQTGLIGGFKQPIRYPHYSQISGTRVPYSSQFHGGVPHRNIVGIGGVPLTGGYSPYYPPYSPYYLGNGYSPYYAGGYPNGAGYPYNGGYYGGYDGLQQGGNLATVESPLITGTQF